MSDLCVTCGDRLDRPDCLLIFEKRGTYPNEYPIQVGVECANGHRYIFPVKRGPLHQGAMWLDEVAEVSEVDSEVVADAVADGGLVTDFDGEGVWLGDWFRWYHSPATAQLRSASEPA